MKAKQNQACYQWVPCHGWEFLKNASSHQEPWFHFPAQMKEEQKFRFSQKWKLLALAGPTFANLPGHLIINLKKLMTDSLNTSWAQPELFSFLHLLSPFIWVLSSLPCLHFSLLLQTWVTILASLPPSGKYGKLPVGVWFTNSSHLPAVMQTEKMLKREKTNSIITQGSFNFYFKHNRQTHQKLWDFYILLHNYSIHTNITIL